MTIQRSLEKYPDVENAIQDISRILNNTIAGKIDNVATVTLTTSSSTTAVTNAKVHANSLIVFMPTTANAAAELTAMYVSARTNNSFTITHNNSATADRTYVYAVFG